MRVYKECCKNCLLSPDAIVGAKRRRDIIQDCAQNQTHFICHKATIEGKDICCKTYFDTLGHLSQMVRIAGRLGMIEYVDQPESERLKSHKEMSND